MERIKHFRSFKTRKETAKETFIYRSWWVFVFLSLCYLFYSQGIKKKNQTLSALESQLVELESQKQIILQEREDLLLQINSQSDPAWIQMTLMKGLGVVPEGQLKVYFKNEEE